MPTTGPSSKICCPSFGRAGGTTCVWRSRALFIVLVVAKLITVAVPVAFKWATDWLALDLAKPEVAASKNLALGIAMLIVAYGTGRVLMMVLNQVRDVLFTRVGQHAIRELNNRTFRHLHKLSLRFHLERRTGGLSRVIERGTRGIDLIVRMGVMQLAPTVIELVLVAGLLVFYFDWTYVLILMVTVAAYMWFTFSASERRIAIRREMNESDTEANTKAIDSLLNFETVKYFGNEEAEARRYDVSMARYEKAAVKTYYSLGYLNSGQAAIYTVGMTLVMWLAARGVMAGTHTVGDFVLINAVLIQLYQPLEFHGHGLPRDQARPCRSRDNVRPSRRQAGCRGQAGRDGACRSRRHRAFRERVVFLRRRPQHPA